MTLTASRWRRAFGFELPDGLGDIAGGRHDTSTSTTKIYFIIPKDSP